QAAEVRAAGVRVADGLHDSQAVAFEKLPCFCHGRVQADALVDLNELILRQPQLFTAFGVALVGERDDGVDTVVAAAELQDDEDAAVPVRHSGAGGVRQEGRYHRGQGHQ